MDHPNSVYPSSGVLERKSDKIRLAWSSPGVTHWLGISPQLRLERGRPQRAIVPVLQRHGHDLRRPVDCDVTEKLQAFAGRLVRCARRLHVDELRSERVVHLVLREASGVDRAGHEFPE